MNKIVYLLSFKPREEIPILKKMPCSYEIFFSWPNFKKALSQKRPHGVILLISQEEILSPPLGLLEIEKRIFQESLRIVVWLECERASLLFSENDAFKFSWILSLRDLIPFYHDMSYGEHFSFLERTFFSLGFENKNHYQEYFKSQIQYSSSATLFIPGRLSWFLDSRNEINIEASVLVEEKEAFLLIETEKGWLRLSPYLWKSRRENLRFNYGAQTIISLNEKDKNHLKQILQNKESIKGSLLKALICLSQKKIKQEVLSFLKELKWETKTPLTLNTLENDCLYFDPDLILFDETYASFFESFPQEKKVLVQDLESWKKKILEVPKPKEEKIIFPLWEKPIRILIEIPTKISRISPLGITFQCNSILRPFSHIFLNMKKDQNYSIIKIHDFYISGNNWNIQEKRYTNASFNFKNNSDLLLENFGELFKELFPEKFFSHTSNPSKKKNKNLIYIILFYIILFFILLIFLALLTISLPQDKTFQNAFPDFIKNKFQP